MVIYSIVENIMPKTKVVYYQEEDGKSPITDWLDRLFLKDRELYIKLKRKITLLGTFGHELRRPDADYLCEGIYELRLRYKNVHYRMLYFFFGSHVAVLTSGFTKTSKIPQVEIDKALIRKLNFTKNPEVHTHHEESEEDNRCA